LTEQQERWGLSRELPSSGRAECWGCSRAISISRGGRAAASAAILALSPGAILGLISGSATATAQFVAKAGAGAGGLDGGTK